MNILVALLLVIALSLSPAPAEEGDNAVTGKIHLHAGSEGTTLGVGIEARIKASDTIELVIGTEEEHEF